MYTGFAGVYDELMRDVDYKSWAEFYRTLLQDRVPVGGSICEYACGTGNITNFLYDFGYRITGADLSADMLNIASQKARAAGRSIIYILQDMRAVNLHHPQKAILCTNDGVNYLSSENELLQFFKSAWNALCPGGVLCFDLSTPYKIRNILGDHFIGDETENISYLWQNRYSSVRDSVQMNIAVFKRIRDEEYHRILETQCQYAHSRERLMRLLAESGFQNIEVLGDKRMREPLPNDYRWFVRANKPEATVSEGYDNESAK